MPEAKPPLRRSARPVIRDYSDPAFSRGASREEPMSFARAFLIAFFSLSLFFGFGILAARSPWFFIKYTTIDGLEFVDEREVRKSIESMMDDSLYGVFPRKHRLFFDGEAVKRELLATYPFSEVSIEQHADTLRVVVRERPTGVYVSDRKNPVFTDLTGVVVRPATAEETDLVGKSVTSLPFLLLYVESEILAKSGERLFTDGFLTDYQSLKLHFEIETGLPVHEYVLPRQNATWIKVKLTDRREIYFDMTRPVEQQVRKLLALIASKGKELDAVSYIDLRFPDRAYFK